MINFDELEEWARNLAEFLSDDKSNDWSLELFQLNRILGDSE